MSSSSHPQDTPSYMIKGRWIVRSMIGQGSFGSVFSGVDNETGEEVAIKISRDPESVDSILQEKIIYEKLGKMPNPHPGFLQCFYAGKLKNGVAVIVMEKGGENLFDLDNSNARRKGSFFKLKELVSFGVQIISSLKTLHGLGYLHNSITPSNLLVDRNDKTKVKLFDFGSSIQFLTEKGDIMPTASAKGSADFLSSLAIHKGQQVGMRDDLESLGYVLVYLYKGLPWNYFPFGLDDLLWKWQERKWEKQKENVSFEKLCEGMGSGFIDYFKYVRGLKDFEKPDYDLLIERLQSTLLERTSSAESDSLTVSGNDVNRIRIILRKFWCLR